MKTAFNGGNIGQLKGGGEITVQWTTAAVAVATMVTAAMRTTTAVAAAAMMTTMTMAAAIATAAGTDNNQLWHQGKLQRQKQ